jgi:hypothetical protein
MGPSDTIYCRNAGYLVGAKWRVAAPDEPALGEEEKGYRGCGNLHCASCGFRVKHWDGRRWRGPVTTIVLAPGAPDPTPLIQEAYHAADADRFLAPAPRSRAYSCVCDRVDITGLDDMRMTSLPLNWSCAGHPS